MKIHDAVFLAINYAAGPAFQNLMLKAVDDNPDLPISELREVLTRHASRARDAVLEEGTVDICRIPRESGEDGLQSKRLGMCAGCGGEHDRLRCRFYTAISNYCHKRGHLNKMCRSLLKETPRDPDTTVIEGVVVASELSDGEPVDRVRRKAF